MNSCDSAPSRKHPKRTPSQRKFKKIAGKAGLPPGTLVHVGEQKLDRVRVTRMIFSPDAFREDTLDELTPDSCKPGPGEVVWINIDGLHEVPLLEAVGKCFNIHPLVLEDILNTNQRPKYDDYNQYLFIVIKMLSQGNGCPEDIKIEQVSLLLLPNVLLTFQEDVGDVFDLIRERARTGRGRVRREGADYLAYALLDTIVDHYFILLERLGEEIEDLEEELMTDPRREMLARIHRLRGDLLTMRRAVWPLREVIGSLQRVEQPLFKPSTMLYLRDLYDHCVQVIDTIETYRDIMAGMMDIYLSSVSNRMNEIMKVLTVISTIFIPLTFIVGVYGMNFDFMPELHSKWGYPAVWGVMLLVVGVMAGFFKRKHWF